MKRLAIAILALSALAGLAPSAGARTRTRTHAPKPPACCRVVAGTPVRVELVDAVSSAKQKRGDTFALRLAAPLIVDGKVVLRAGTLGVGEVIDSTPPGIGGKPAEMVLAATYLQARRARVPLDAMQLASAGRDNSTASHVLGIGGIAFAPLGIVGIVMQGGQVEFKPGAVATAKVASAVTLPSLGRATRLELVAAASASQAASDQTASLIDIPPPPAGQGQVVFFRAKTLMGSGQWFNVREDGKALGKLSNGAYFIQIANPGVHAYTAVLEPELKDKLKLKVDAGETYYVKGDITGGLVLGAANLSPSDQSAFDAAAKDLKPSAAPDDDKAGGAAPEATPTSDAPATAPPATSPPPAGTAGAAPAATN